MTEENIGHNSTTSEDGQEVTPEIFHGFAAQLAAVDAEKKLVGEKRSKIRKAAKAAGIKLGVLDIVLKLADLPRNDQQDELRWTKTYLEWFMAPSGSQLQFNLDPDVDPIDGDDAEAEKRASEEAKGQGFRHGLRGGGEADLPYAANTPAGRCWLDGFREGEAKFNKALADQAEKDAVVDPDEALAEVESLDKRRKAKAKALA